MTSYAHRQPGSRERRLQMLVAQHDALEEQHRALAAENRALKAQIRELCRRLEALYGTPKLCQKK